MLNRGRRGHQESTSSRLPIQTPEQGIYGEQQSKLDLAWKERRQELRREHNWTESAGRSLRRG